MIKAIIFDFDGVIVESADIKTDAFKELFSDHPEKLQEIIDYHLENAGISRYIKFRHVYKYFLGKGLSAEEESDLGKRFSQIVLKRVLAASFVPGVKEFFSKNKDRYQFFIASGTPEEELREIVLARGLAGYFKEVCGSPREKNDIITDIIKKYDLAKDEVAYVGDAYSDRAAAEKAGVIFIERAINSKPGSGGNLRVIRDLSGLGRVLKNINLQGERSI